MKSKFLLLSLGLCLLAAAALLIESTPQQNVSHLENKALEKMGIQPAQIIRADEDSTETTSSESHEQKPIIHQWLDENSNQISSFSEQDQKVLTQKINELHQEEITELKRISSSTALPANKRILSLYMLGESRFGEEALKEFLSSEIRLTEDAPPHSLDETSNGREKALRVMAVEQLIDNAGSPQEAYRKLTELIPHLKDPWLKQFAKNKADELSRH